MHSCFDLNVKPSSDVVHNSLCKFSPYSLCCKAISIFFRLIHLITVWLVTHTVAFLNGSCFWFQYITIPYIFILKRKRMRHIRFRVCFCSVWMALYGLIFDRVADLELWRIEHGAGDGREQWRLHQAPTRSAAVNTNSSCAKHSTTRWNHTVSRHHHHCRHHPQHQNFAFFMDFRITINNR